MSSDISQSSPSGPESASLEHVKMLAEYGHTEEFIAKFCGVSPKTFRRWKRENSEFEAALLSWKSRADDRVEKALYERAIGFMHLEEKVFCSKEGFVTKVDTVKAYPPDPTAAIFWLKNRKPKDWKDRVEHKHDGEIQHTYQVREQSVQDRLKDLAESDGDLNAALE